MGKGDFTPYSRWEDPHAGHRGIGDLFKKWTARSPEVSDASIDKLLAKGKNPRSALRRAMSQMSPGDRKTVQRRITARETKRKQ